MDKLPDDLVEYFAEGDDLIRRTTSFGYDKNGKAIKVSKKQKNLGNYKKHPKLRKLLEKHSK